MLSERQKSLINRQKEEEEANESFLVTKSLVRVGDRIEFLETPEYNGVVTRITNDQWKMIIIDYGVPGHSKIIHQNELTGLVQRNLAKVIPVSKEEHAKQVKKEIIEDVERKEG